MDSRLLKVGSKGCSETLARFRIGFLTLVSGIERSRNVGKFFIEFLTLVSGIERFRNVGNKLLLLAA